MTGLLASTWVEERRGYLAGTTDRRSQFRTPFWFLVIPLLAVLLWIAPIWHPYAKHSSITIGVIRSHGLRQPAVDLSGSFVVPCPPTPGLPEFCRDLPVTAKVELSRSPFGPADAVATIGGQGSASVRLSPGIWWLTVDVDKLLCPYQTPFEVPAASRIAVQINCH
ncbi:MAG: hypothetical protein ACJ77A_16580 [Actinomycetota bacterium]